MYKNFHLLLFFCFCLFSCRSSKESAAKENILSASDLHPYGRYRINYKHQLELISSGVHFGFIFKGTQCKIFAANFYAGGHNYLQYVLDGVYQKRIKVVGNSMEPIILEAVNPGKHRVCIYKATEATTGDILIEKITGQNVVALKKPTLPLIEFIGNSITCAAAADPSEVPCGTGEYHDQHNAYFAYGPRVARALGTEFIISGISGIGIYRSWNTDGPDMPHVYEYTDFQENSLRYWNFNAYIPKVVSIALGTNDLSDGDGIKKRSSFDSIKFVTEYIKFIQLVKSKYPVSQIALLSSPTINGAHRRTLQNCLSVVKQRVDALYLTGKPIALYFFNEMKPRGCGGHPSVEDHAILAQELIPFFKKLLQ